MSRVSCRRVHSFGERGLRAAVRYRFRLTFAVKNAVHRFGLQVRSKLVRMLWERRVKPRRGIAHVVVLGLKPHSPRMHRKEGWFARALEWANAGVHPDHVRHFGCVLLYASYFFF
jgi:hypothetical protein